MSKRHKHHHRKKLDLETEMIKFRLPGTEHVVARPASTTGYFCTEHQFFIYPTWIGIFPEEPEAACHACLEEVLDDSVACDAVRTEDRTEFCTEASCIRRPDGICIKCRERFCEVHLSLESCLCDACSIGTADYNDEDIELGKEVVINMFGDIVLDHSE